MLNPENAGLFTIKVIINQSLKQRILVKAYHAKFVQCVSPITVLLLVKHAIRDSVLGKGWDSWLIGSRRETPPTRRGQRPNPP